jgi:hypothetical protein
VGTGSADDSPVQLYPILAPQVPMSFEDSVMNPLNVVNASAWNVNHDC